MRAKSLGLTRARWSILARLVRCQGIQQSQLAELLELKAITIARHIDRLEQAVGLSVNQIRMIDGFGGCF